jgi:DNA polymerase-3 subunit gamma/tau
LQALREGKNLDVVELPQPVPAPVPGRKPFQAEAGAAHLAAPQSAVALAATEIREQAPSPVPAPARRAEEGTPAEADLEGLWARLVEAVGRASPFTRTYLLEAHPVSFAKELFTIGFDPEFEDHLGLVDNARNHTLLQTKLLELGHPNAQIKFVKAEAPARSPRQSEATPQTAPPPPAPAPPAPVQKAAGPARSAATPAPVAKEKLAPVPFSKDDFKNDPLIQKALEIFKGQIVEVRA